MKLEELKRIATESLTTIQPEKIWVPILKLTAVAEAAKAHEIAGIERTPTGASLCDALAALETK